MSIQSEISRISENIANAYSAIQEKGGGIPEEPTADSLAEAVKSINAEVYSTKEIRIGTWIDGKPLYQKTKIVTIPGNNNWFDAGEFLINEDTVVELTGSIYHNGSYSKWICLPFGNYVFCGTSQYGNLVVFSTNDYAGNKLICRAKYTKTTDQPSTILYAELFPKGTPDEIRETGLDKGFLDFQGVAVTAQNVTEKINVVIEGSD